jgi:hypothetical protein
MGDCYNQSWQYNNFINIRKQRNLLDAKMKNALVKCSEELKRLARFFSFIQLAVIILRPIIVSNSRYILMVYFTKVTLGSLLL